MKTNPFIFSATGSREARLLASPIELRAAGEDATSGKLVFGYAAKFGLRSQNLGTADYQFFEIIQPGAFDDVLADDVRALFNHEPEMILARSKNGAGTLTLAVDETGLSYQFEAPDTQTGRDLLVSLSRGDIDQSSFSFSVSKDGQSWVESKEGDGPTIITRTISKFSRLYDVSPVTYPAYEETEVDCRSLAAALQGLCYSSPPPAPADYSVSHWSLKLALIDSPTA